MIVVGVHGVVYLGNVQWVDGLSQARAAGNSPLAEHYLLAALLLDAHLLGRPAGGAGIGGGLEAVRRALRQPEAGLDVPRPVHVARLGAVPEQKVPGRPFALAVKDGAGLG